MQNLRRFFSIFLLAIISFYSVPKELLHAFSSHHDTEDVICTDYCAHHFTNEHKHCEMLQLSVPPLHYSLQNFSFVLSGLLMIAPAEKTHEYHFSLSPFLFFRGPPALV
jgi:hypothetical protein